jgi:hypothetical protein
MALTLAFSGSVFLGRDDAAADGKDVARALALQQNPVSLALRTHCQTLHVLD